MALFESERNMGVPEDQDVNIQPILGFLKEAPAAAVYDASKKNKSVSHETIPHVKDINEYVSFVIEKEIAAQNPDLNVRRPLGLRKMASLLPTVLS